MMTIWWTKNQTWQSPSTRWRCHPGRRARPARWRGRGGRAQGRRPLCPGWTGHAGMVCLHTEWSEKVRRRRRRRRISEKNSECASNRKWGIPCHRPWPRRSPSPSSCGGACVLGGGVVACSPCPAGRGRLRTRPCGLRTKWKAAIIDWWSPEVVTAETEAERLGQRKSEPKGSVPTLSSTV